MDDGTFRAVTLPVRVKEEEGTKKGIEIKQNKTKKWQKEKEKS